MKKIDGSHPSATITINLKTAVEIVGNEHSQYMSTI